MVTASVPDPALNLIVDDTSVETTVRCRGRIVSSTADLLKATIRPLILDQKTIWLDLSDVTYMDSSGLGAVVGLFVTARRVKAYLKLINMSPQIRQLFSITKLGEFFIEGQDPDYPESPVRQPR